jgi:hypothetical protein
LESAAAAGKRKADASRVRNSEMERQRSMCRGGGHLLRRCYHDGLAYALGRWLDKSESPAGSGALQSVSAQYQARLRSNSRLCCVWASVNTTKVPSFKLSWSPPSYPSAWVRPRSARFRFARQDHCSYATTSRFSTSGLCVNQYARIAISVRATLDLAQTPASCTLGT